VAQLLCSAGWFPSGKFLEFLNHRLKSPTVALVVLISRREPHHLTFEAQEFIPGFNCYIWIYKFHNDRLVRT
jgi:hypothetical protein